MKFERVLNMHLKYALYLFLLVKLAGHHFYVFEEKENITDGKHFIYNLNILKNKTKGVRLEFGKFVYHYEVMHNLLYHRLTSSPPQQNASHKSYLISFQFENR